MIQALTPEEPGLVAEKQKRHRVTDGVMIAAHEAGEGMFGKRFTLSSSLPFLFSPVRQEPPVLSELLLHQVVQLRRVEPS